MNMQFTRVFDQWIATFKSHCGECTYHLQDILHEYATSTNFVTGKSSNSEVFIKKEKGNTAFLYDNNDPIGSCGI